MNKKYEKKINYYIKNGISGMLPASAVELLLSYTDVPDPADVTRRLFEKLKLPEAVLNASEDDLRSCGMTEQATQLFRNLQSIYSLTAPLDVIGGDMRAPGVAEDYFARWFRHANVEQFRFCCLDERYMPLCCCLIGLGSGAEVTVSAAEIIAEAKMRGSRSVIIAHNHPAGSCSPSSSDINATAALEQELASAGIELVGHVVCGTDGRGKVGEMQRGM